MQRDIQAQELLMRLEGRVEKTWGREEIFATNDMYCGKYLIFDKVGNKTSMHYHAKKHETWQVVRGRFIVRAIYVNTGEVHEHILDPGQTWTNRPLIPHQLEALEDDSCVIEVSTADSVEDNYRVYR
jgi:D-lyxose ketol-isomerase